MQRGKLLQLDMAFVHLWVHLAEEKKSISEEKVRTRRLTVGPGLAIMGSLHLSPSQVLNKLGHINLSLVCGGCGLVCVCVCVFEEEPVSCLCQHGDQHRKCM